MTLATDITNFYFLQADRLPSAKRFHWASRLAAWTSDPRARTLLEACRAEIVPAAAQPEQLQQLFMSLATTEPDDSLHIPAFAVRQPYFQKYQPLFGLELALFRLRHMDAVYGVDARQSLFAAVPQTTLLDVEQRLLADRNAMATLSTYAVNYCYLLHRVLLVEDQNIDVAAFYALGQLYDTNNKEQLRLLIYLYTHCIVAESNFYVRAIPKQYLTTYRAMLATIEGLLTVHFKDCSLDTKLEFLVCCRISNYETSLSQQIQQECETSLSLDGNFLVDTHNSFAGIDAKRSFEASEHRNVLYVMSCSAYSPAIMPAASRLTQ